MNISVIEIIWMISYCISTKYRVLVSYSPCMILVCSFVITIFFILDLHFISYLMQHSTYPIPFRVFMHMPYIKIWDGRNKTKTRCDCNDNSDIPLQRIEMMCLVWYVDMVMTFCRERQFVIKKQNWRCLLIMKSKNDFHSLFTQRNWTYSYLTETFWYFK